MLVEAVQGAGGCGSLSAPCIGSAGVRSCSCLLTLLWGVHLGVSCFTLCWMCLSAVLDEHLVLEQMMVGYLLSGMWCCLQAFQHHPGIKKDGCFEFFEISF